MEIPPIMHARLSLAPTETKVSLHCQLSQWKIKELELCCTAYSHRVFGYSVQQKSLILWRACAKYRLALPLGTLRDNSAQGPLNQCKRIMTDKCLPLVLHMSTRMDQCTYRNMHQIHTGNHLLKFVWHSLTSKSLQLRSVASCNSTLKSHH